MEHERHGGPAPFAVAFHLWADGGWSDFKPGERDDRDMVVWGYLIRRRDIPGYFTEKAMSAVRIWQNYRRFGWPFAGGWAEQPAPVTDIVELFEDEMAKRRIKEAGPRGRK